MIEIQLTIISLIVGFIAGWVFKPNKEDKK